MIQAAPRGADGADSPDGSDGSDGANKGGKQLAAVDPFPTDVLPAPLARYVREGAKSVGCPEDYFGVALLCLAGAAIGNSRAIELKPTWRETALTWVAVVGDPGMLKSPMLGLVTKPFEERQLRLEEEFVAAWRAYKEELELHEQAKKPKEGKPADELPAADATASDASPEPVPPVLERCITGDTTVEAVAKLLKENPRGLLLCRDELAAWTLAMNQYRGGRGSDRQFYMSIWCGATIWLDRKGEPRPLMVPDPFLSILGCLCPDMLGELAGRGDRQDGFMDRVLFCYPDAPPPPTWSEDEISLDAERAWRDAVEALFALEPEWVEGRPKARVVRLSPPAKEAWVEFYNGHSREMGAADFPGGLKGFWSKLRGYAARLALILHELRLVTGESTSGEAVDEPAMRGGIVLAEYFATHAARVHKLMSPKAELASHEKTAMEAVANLVGAKGGAWEGTAEQLQAMLNGAPESNDAKGWGMWPASPESLGRALRRLADRLKKDHGLELRFSRAPDRKRTRLIALKKLSGPSAAGATPEKATSCKADGSRKASAAAKQTVQATQGSPRTVSGNGSRKR
jgi:hypothetical protein